MTIRIITVPQARFNLDRASDTYAVDRWLEGADPEFVVTQELHFVLQYRVEGTWIVSIHENKRWNDLRPDVMNAMAAAETSVILSVFGGICINNEVDPEIDLLLDDDDDPDKTGMRI